MTKRAEKKLSASAQKKKKLNSQQWHIWWWWWTFINVESEEYSVCWWTIKQKKEWEKGQKFLMQYIIDSVQTNKHKIGLW